MKQKLKLDRVRYETFGGIISSLEPPFIAWVDKKFMKKSGFRESPHWKQKPPSTDYLLAPTEVHFSITNRCDQKCSHCYMDSGTDSEDSLDTNEIKAVLDQLNEKRVFHIAFGGGEAFLRSDFPEIVDYCSQLGMVPNLTSNGQDIRTEHIDTLKKMGQINFSVDGIADRFMINGREGCFEKLQSSINFLRKNRIYPGFNTVVSKMNFDHLEEIVQFANKNEISEVEFLKYKPLGRSRKEYEQFSLTQEQIRSFYPKLEKLQKQYSVQLKIDCSFIPSMVYHKPKIKNLVKLGITGCDAGNTLLSINSKAIFSGCSFVANSETVTNFAENWTNSEQLTKFRNLSSKIAEPCRSCNYLSVCKGGCRAVAIHQSGNFSQPDNECPFVYDYNRRKDEK